MACQLKGLKCKDLSENSTRKLNKQSYDSHN